MHLLFEKKLKLLQPAALIISSMKSKACKKKIYLLLACYAFTSTDLHLSPEYLLGELDMELDPRLLLLIGIH